jgi:hypothetical protein
MLPLTPTADALIQGGQPADAIRRAASTRTSAS